ncbi:olfactory receptor 7G2-like [Fukomys damarensis]|uniref:olfactory receptor 7G2-like n=1 Tax=Fukomys damarensis TaxID=885580 RepID=UPI0014555B34|nr:olfactory receptor 7G2-like [Fukomys damarensis]
MSHNLSSIFRTADPNIQPVAIHVPGHYPGNLLVILAVSSDSHLHTPMYFFLYSLSLNNICLSTRTVPKMLVSIQTQDHSINQRGYLAQICLVLVFSGLETCLLPAMAYDRYVAICHPLRYAVILNICMCVSLTLFLFISITDGLPYILMMLRLSICIELRIPHFSVNLPKLSGSLVLTLLVDNNVIYIAVCILGDVPAFGIILSYIHIVSSILRMPSP